jgi:hypothetical protein
MTIKTVSFMLIYLSGKMMNDCNTETSISNSRFQWHRQAVAIEHFKPTLTADFGKTNTMVTANLKIEYEL